MDTNCALLVADFFLFCYERDFMMPLSDDKQADVIDALNTSSRYLDDILNINNVYFDNMVSQIYPSELQLNKANASDTKAACLDLHLSPCQVGLKSLLRQGLSEPDFYGDLVYKLKKIVGSNNFSAEFIKIIFHYKKIGYKIYVLQQTACLVVNPITVGNFAFLFNCTPLGRTSDSMMVPT